MDSHRPRANTLGIDTSLTGLLNVDLPSPLTPSAFAASPSHYHKHSESEEEAPSTPDARAAAILSSHPPVATPRNRSRTVVNDSPQSYVPSRPLSTMLKNHPGLSDSNSPINGRPLSMLLSMDGPDSPSVMGMKGRHRLQREGSASDQATGAASLSAQLRMRGGNWCDVERQNLAAYEYLCHVCEAKEWMEACIEEDLPDITVMEESLRDGVALAKLARTFCPEAVGKIYQQPSGASAIPMAKGVRHKFVFKYTDNINFFLRAIRQVCLPRLFHFELTDLYDRKNMPRVIYCLHALSHFLLNMGIAPQMRDLVGHLEFTDAQLAQTQAELDGLGVKVPSFKRIDSDIGNRRPRLSLELQPPNYQPPDEEGMSDYGEELSPPRHKVAFDEDVAYLDDPGLDCREKAKRYWEKRIDIVMQFQALGRQRLAERLVDEKRQARRYLRMVDSATVMQSMVRMVLAKRQLAQHREERDALVRAKEEEKLQKQKKEEEEEKRMEEKLHQHARKDREEREAKERAQKKHQLEEERTELERRIIGVQALVRGKLARKVFSEMRGWTAAIIHFQALARGSLVRREIGDRLSKWGRVEASVRRVQALARGYLVRHRIRDYRTHLRRNVNIIVKMQNMYRAKLAGKAYRTLTVEDTPPTPKIVQSCTPLLEDTDQDLEEELELERLRQKAVRQIRDNQQTTRILDQLDIRIALLVRNRISLEEAVRQTKRHFSFLEELRRPSSLSSVGYRSAYSSFALSGAIPSNSLYSLRNMDKESRKKLEGYQHLFYLLQTQPVYLARFLFLLNQGGSKAIRQSLANSSSPDNKQGHRNPPQNIHHMGKQRDCSPSFGEDISISKLVETIVLTLFGFAQNAREEYLLLKLFCAAIQIELASIETLQEFLRGNPIFIKLAVHYNRGAKERKYLRDLLQPLIKKVIDDPDLDLESDPLVIYRTLIREEESRTGEKSRRPYDITREDALNDMETRTTFIRHLRQLRVLADEFIAAIQGSLNNMPYGMRYIARELRRALAEKFPDEPESQVMKIVGHLVYYRYINPAIVAPETFDVIETTISPLQRKNLAEIAKMLNQVSVGKHFNEDNMFLQPLNNYVGYTSAKFLAYSFEVTDVVDPEVHFQVDEFTDLATLEKPSIFMSIGEIQAMHQALEANLDTIAPPVPDQIKQRFGSYDAVMGIIERRRQQEEERVANGSHVDLTAANEEDEDTDLVDALPQGTVLVEQAAGDGSEGRVLVLDDPLRVVLQSLGPAPRSRSDPHARSEIQLDLADRFADDSIAIMSGSPATSALAASASQILSDAAISASQIANGGLLRNLQHSSAKEAVHAKAERAAKLHRLFLETKRKWLSILQVQSGQSLLEILDRPVTPEDESRWRAAIQLELAKLEDRRQRQKAQWRMQWEAQQQAAQVRESQEAIVSQANPLKRPGSSMSNTATNGRSAPSPAPSSQHSSQPPAPPAPPALPGEKVIRELSRMTFAELKRQTAKAMRILETERWVQRTRKSNIGTGGKPKEDNSGPRPAYTRIFRVRRTDGYQGMLNAIARDIRTKAQRRERRRAEMRRIRITLLNLREKSDYLESQRQSYEEYLDTCTKKLAAGGDSTISAAQTRARKMHSVMPFTRQYFHLRDLQRSGRVPRFGSYKYSAEKLYYKGVIVSVDGYPPRQLDKISLTISSDEPGVFDVQVSLMGVKMPGGGCELNMQDLLQLQYDNVQTMALYEDSVVVNTNLLVYLINKKFYS